MKKQGKKARPFSLRYLFYDFIRFTSWPFVYLFLRPKLHYISKAARRRTGGGAIVMCNHTSFLDPVHVQFAMWHRRVHFLATKSMFDTPLKRWFFRTALCHPIDKENISIDSMRQMGEIISDGKILCVFPEGMINEENERLRTFKSGIVLLAYKNGVPIYPVYTNVRKSAWNRSHIIVGEPIFIREICGDRPTKEKLELAAEALMAAMLELEQYYLERFKLGKRKAQARKK